MITAPLDYQNPDAEKYFRELKQLAKKLNVQENVIFLSQLKLSNGRKFNLEHLKVLQLYLLADFLLIPSKLEGFGLQIIEAGLTKTPIVSSDIPPFKETAQNYAYSFKLCDSPKNIAVNIIKYLARFPSNKFYRRSIKEFTLTEIYYSNIKPMLRGLYEKK